jgi:hypothetical protein
MTLVIVSGWLVTVANTGDSSAVLDSGDHISEITFSHRIQVGGARRAHRRAWYLCTLSWGCDACELVRTCMRAWRRVCDVVRVCAAGRCAGACV